MQTGKSQTYVSDHSKCGKLFFIEADNLDLDKTGNYLPLLPTCMGSGPGLRYQKPRSAELPRPWRSTFENQYKS